MPMSIKEAFEKLQNEHSFLGPKMLSYMTNKELLDRVKNLNDGECSTKIKDYAQKGGGGYVMYFGDTVHLSTYLGKSREQIVKGLNEGDHGSIGKMVYRDGDLSNPGSFRWNIYVFDENVVNKILGVENTVTPDPELTIGGGKKVKQVDGKLI
jgi:hypothetical protein